MTAWSDRGAGLEVADACTGFGQPDGDVDCDHRWRVRCAWVATANNLRLAPDAVRRTILCRLDPHTDHPEDRNNFRHSLPAYAYEHRAELVWAALTIARAWLAAGRPSPSAIPLGSFEAWTATIGGILEHASIRGFLEDRDALRADADVEREPEAWLVEQWWESFHEDDVTAAQLWKLVRFSEDLPAGLINGSNDHARSSSLGVRLGKMRDRVFTLEIGVQVRLAKGTKRRGNQQWRLSEQGRLP